MDLLLCVVLCCVPGFCFLKAHLANEEYKKSMRTFLAEEKCEFDKWQRGEM